MSEHAAKRIRGGLAVAIAALAVAGCTTERIVSSDGRPMPVKPRRARPVPLDAAPGRLALFWSPPTDGDGNGFPDLIRAEAVLFPVQRATAMQANGALVFTLYRMGDARTAEAEPIARWRLEGEALAGSLVRKVYGPTYVVELSLLDAGSDRMPPTQADLRAAFEPADAGPTIHTSDEVRPVQLGRRSQSFGGDR